MHLQVSPYEFRMSPGRLFRIYRRIPQGARRGRALGKEILPFHDPTIAMRRQGLLSHDLAFGVAFPFLHRHCVASHGPKPDLVADFRLRERFLERALQVDAPDFALAIRGIDFDEIGYRLLRVVPVSCDAVINECSRDWAFRSIANDQTLIGARLRGLGGRLGVATASRRSLRAKSARSNSVGVYPRTLSPKALAAPQASLRNRSDPETVMSFQPRASAMVIRLFTTSIFSLGVIKARAAVSKGVCAIGEIVAVTDLNKAFADVIRDQTP